MSAARQPPLRDFADRGTAWLLESPENLRGLLRIVDGSLADRLDFARAEPVHRPMVGDDLDKRLTDVIHRVPYADGSTEVWVCVLLEHQSTPDLLMGYRLLRYQVGLWGLQIRKAGTDDAADHESLLQPIVPVVFYTGTRDWTAPLSIEAVMRVPDPLSRFVPRHDTLFLKLRDIPAERLIGSAMAYVLRVMQVEDAPLETLEQVLAQAVAGLDDLPEEDWAQWHDAMYYLVLLIHHRRAVSEQDRLVSVVTTAVHHHRKDVEEMTMTGAEALIEKGKQLGLEAGRKEGREEGREEGRKVLLASLLKLLGLRFGPLPQHVPVALEAMSAEALTSLFDLALTAESLADLPLGLKP